MSQNRDEFTTKTKRDLAQRVGHVCSNPDCLEHTVGPTVDEAGVSNTGRASHIRAAAAGGPRYDVSMSSQERRSIRNGIWLCGSCAAKVDNDEAGYPTELLQQWKCDAELRTRRRQGQPLLTEAVAQKQMESVFSASPNRFSLNALANAVCAATSHLSSLDDRFSVSVSLQGGGTRVELRPKVDVPLSMSFVPVDRDAAKVELADLNAHGGCKRFAVSRFVLIGSRLVSTLLSDMDAGVLQLSTQQRPAALELWLQMPDGTKVDLFAMDGTVVGGTRTHTVTTSAFDGVFEISAWVPHVPSEDLSLQITFGLDTEKWQGKNVKRLAGVVALQTLFGSVLDGARLMAEAFFGEHSIWTADITPSDLAFAGQQFAVVAYARHARTLAEHLDLSLTFSSSYGFDSEEFFQIAQIAAIADGTAIGEVKGDIEATVTWKALDGLRSLKGSKVAMSFHEDVGKVIKVYGQNVQLPPVGMDVEVVFPEVAGLGGPQSIVMKPVAGAIGRCWFLKGGEAREAMLVSAANP